MNKNLTILIILNDHERRVRLRKMAEENFGVTVFSVASATDGLALLHKIKPPAFILLSSGGMPMMTYQEFLTYKCRDPDIARVPVVLLSITAINPLPEGVAQEVITPLSKNDLEWLVKRYCES